MSDNGHAFWERTAGRYDLSMALLGGPLAPMCSLIADDVRGSSRVLELAAGTGLVTRAIAPQVEQLVATDYSQAMVSKLRQRSTTEGLTNVSVQVLDVFELDQPEAYDVIVAANVLHLLPDVERALDRMRAALRPDGRLLVPTYCHGQNIRSRSMSYLMGLMRFPGQRRLTLDSLASLISNHGFEMERSQLLPGLLPIGYVSGRKALDI